MSALLGWPNLSFLRFCHCVFLGLWDLKHIPPNTYMFSGWLRTQSATGYLLRGVPLDMRVILPSGFIENWLSIRSSLVATNEPMNSLFKSFKNLFSYILHLLPPPISIITPTSPLPPPTPPPFPFRIGQTSQGYQPNTTAYQFVIKTRKEDRGARPES